MGGVGAAGVAVMAQLVDLRGPVSSVEGFAALGQALVAAFEPGTLMSPREAGFFVFLDASGSIVGSLEFSGDQWHLRWPGPRPRPVGQSAQ